ncbi:MAG: hypothetical protein ACRDL7_04745, partial [Gaiellaceae bacterium]
MIVEIMGKSDDVLIPMMLWADNDIPELCPVRHLLTYCYLIQITGGYLFPSGPSLLAPPTDGIFEQPINYKTFLKMFQDICKEVIKPAEGPWGTHTCRKTGYLLAVWGDASDVDLLYSARHKSAKTAAKYKKDCALLNHMANAHMFYEKVTTTPKWKPCRLTHTISKAVACRLKESGKLT